MEQKQIKILLIVSLLSLVFSIAALLSVFVIFKKNNTVANIFSTRQLRPQNNEKVDLGPISFDGFAGKLNTLNVENKDDQKIIELKGHKMTNPRKAYEVVPSSDTEIKKIIIDSKTQIYRVERGNEKPEITQIEMKDFMPTSERDEYIASYEAGENETIIDSTPAYMISIYPPKVINK